MKRSIRNALVIIGALVVAWVGIKQIDAAVFAIFRWGGDATDARYSRSGMGLRTDHQTGCQYLVSPYGGITPRMDAAGKHICGK